jgi:rfaE bifunctional protein nucleotidyltransferase chain/domain
MYSKLQKMHRFSAVFSFALLKNLKFATMSEITNSSEPKIIRDADQLEFLCARLRFKDRKIVFTNGCFDILHAGHVSYLQAARALGDILIVGINTDSSIKRLKGESRPIQNEFARYMVLSALECVDYIVPFDTDTPIEIITAIMPDILVKGDDYVPENIVGYTEITAAGGKVTTLPLLQGYSTTDLIQKIQKA